MSQVSSFVRSLSLPVISAPMFLVSGTRLVSETCKQGVVGTFPALNARNETILNDWLNEIKGNIAEAKEEHLRNPSLPNPAPYGVNLIVHKTNKRLAANLDQIVKHQVPLVITSLGAAKEVVDAVHSYGGIVYHDITNVRHAQKAAKAGVDGLIAVCAGAGGHAGMASPFALIPKLREFFPGTICLAGAISDGASVRAAQTLGADIAYIGTRFIATKESMAPEAYKQMLIDAKTGPAPTFLPTVYTDKISGVNANFLRLSLERSGLDPENPMDETLGKEDFSKLDSGGSADRAWRDIWSAGHSVLNIHDIPTVKELILRMRREYQDAVRREQDTAEPYLK